MMSKRLICFLLLSAMLHALLVWLPGFASHSSSGGALSSQTGRINVRLRVLDAPLAIAAPALPGNLAAPEADPTRPEPEEVVQESSPREEAVAAASPVPILPASLPHGFDRDDYFSGDALDVRPAPAQPIVIGVDEPEKMKRDKGQVVLQVYVGTGGQVDHVDIDSSDVPPDIAESLAGLFRAARMRPGIKDDQPVKARMKILVEFEVR